MSGSMRHDEIYNKLSEFYDGELPAAEKSEIQAHLQSCLSCRNQLSEWTIQSKVFFTRPNPLKTEAFVAAVMRRVDALSAPAPFLSKEWLKQWFAPMMGVALAISMLTIGVVTVNERVSTEELLMSDSPAEAVPGGVDALEFLQS